MRRCASSIWAGLLAGALLHAPYSGPAAAQDRDALCANPAAICGREVTPECLQRIGAGALAIGSDCEAQRKAYLDCLRRVPEACGPTPSPLAAGCSAEDARQLFAALDQRNADDLRTFIEACPSSAQALLATSRLRRLEETAAQSEASPDPTAETSAPPAKQAALRRGFQVYSEVCSSCHDIGALPVRALADPKGPGLDDEAVQEALLMFPDVATAFDPYDCTPTLVRPRNLDDPLGGSFALPVLAEQFFFIAPPALAPSTARIGRAQVVAILTGYEASDAAPTPPIEMFYNNAAVPLGIAMPQPLYDEMVLYADGTPATVAQQARDVAAFLEWAAAARRTYRAAPGAPAPTACEETTPRPVFEALRRVASADIGAGESAFRVCRSCHQIERDGAHGVGPNLYGLMYRQIASREGYEYSDALRRFSLRGTGWTFPELIAFLYDPEHRAPGTTMRFRGVREPQNLANIAAYIATASRE